MVTGPELTAGVRRAREFLLAEAAACQQKGESRLPTVKELSRLGGFSPGTITKAVRSLRQEGVLRAVQRGGIHVVGSPDLAAARPGAAGAAAGVTGGRSWERLRQRVARDIVSRTYPPGSVLPSLKELCLTYGASYATIRKALRSLAQSGKLVPYKRGFRVFAPAVQSSHASILVIAHTETIGDLGTVIPRNPEFLRVLENECLRLNIRLVIRSEREVDPLNPGAALGHGAGVAVGYFVWVRGIGLPRVQELLRGLGATKRPVAVLDEDGRMPLSQITRGNPRARVFTVANSMTAGVEVGNFLLGLGHRRVAYLSVVGDSIYCRNRFEGIDQAFRQAGLRDAVVRYVVEKYAGFEQIVRAQMRTRRFRSLAAHLQRFADTVDRGGRSTEDKFYSFYTETYLLRRAIQAELSMALDGVVQDRSASALVGVNDWVALVAMAHARDHGVRVPEQLALVGFDDTFEAFSHGLTSYNFNMPALVQAMLEHVLARPSPRRREALPPLEIPGMVMARESTNTAKQP